MCRHLSGKPRLKFHAEQPHQQHDQEDCHGDVAKGDGDGNPQGGVGEECCQLHNAILLIGREGTNKMRRGVCKFSQWCVNSTNEVCKFVEFIHF